MWRVSSRLQHLPKKPHYYRRSRQTRWHHDDDHQTHLWHYHQYCFMWSVQDGVRYLVTCYGPKTALVNGTISHCDDCCNPWSAATVAAMTVAIATGVVAAVANIGTHSSEPSGCKLDTNHWRDFTQHDARIRMMLSAVPRTTFTSCSGSHVEYPHHHHHPLDNNNGRHLSRLARHRTIQQMESTSSKETLESRYRVQWKEPLGEGAFGAVYVGTDVDNGDRVAVKKIDKRYTDNITFQREMDALLYIRSKGGHPNICMMRENFDSGRDGSWYYIILDLISGGEMFGHLIHDGPYSEADAARLVREVASALAFLHGIGVVHGDLKPENLMLSSPIVSEAVIKVVDFGTAQVLVENDENSNHMEDTLLYSMIRNHPNRNDMANTPAYSPPEALRRKYNTSKPSSTSHSSPFALFKVSPSSSSSTCTTPSSSSSPTSGCMEPSFDMWALGVIIYIMLTGVHPFDLAGNSPDEEVEHRIISHQAPPIRNSPITAHLSDSAKDLMEKLMEWDPSKRLTADDMLQHSWVRGETARTGKMADSDKRLSTYRAFKSKLAAKVFSDMVTWSDEESEEISTSNGSKESVALKRRISNRKENSHDKEDSSTFQYHHHHPHHHYELIAKRTSLLERSFHNLDPTHKGYISTRDLQQLTHDHHSNSKTEENNSDNESKPTMPTGAANTTGPTQQPSEGEGQLSMTGFSDLLAENMKNRYWPKGHVVYREGDVGHAMFFINSGSVEVSTHEGAASIRRQGDNFGEGALLHPKRIRSATVRCITPVHAIEISRDYFEKYIAEESGLKLNLREKDKTRKRTRAKTILRLQQNMKDKLVENGEYIFRAGEDGHELFIIEEGNVDVLVEDHKVFCAKEGDICGEHSLMMGRPRNTSTKCVSENGCKLHVMRDKDFYVLLDSMPAMRESLRDMCLRREFQKALVFRTKKEFPTHEIELKEAFDAADENHHGAIDLSNIEHMLKEMDPTFSDDDVKEILRSLDLDDSGEVNFAEFKRIFGIHSSPTIPSQSS